MKRFCILFVAIMIAASGFAQSKTVYLDLYMRGGGQHLKTTLMYGNRKVYLGRKNLGETLNMLANQGWTVDQVFPGANRSLGFPTRHKFHIILKKEYVEEPDGQLRTSGTESCKGPVNATAEKPAPVWHEEKKIVLQNFDPSTTPKNDIVIVIPDGTEVVDGSEVVDQANLVSVTFPESLLRIRSRAFWNCDRLKVVVCQSQTPPKLGAKAFPDNIDIQVPTTAVDRYKGAPGWSEYSMRISGRKF